MTPTSVSAVSDAASRIAQPAAAQRGGGAPMTELMTENGRGAHH
ncbi:hypothetical protein [Frankia nepalensis]|nr:hypothetical protein [Frankia nepalensis]